MTRRTARRIARFWWAVTLALLVVALALPGQSEGWENWIFGGIALLGVLGYATVGVMIASRHPRNAIGWLFLYFGAMLPLTFLSDTYSDLALREDLPGVTVAALANVVSFPLAMTALPLIFLLFPNGALPSRRWKPVAWGVAGFLTLIAIVTLLRPGPLLGYPNIINPLGLEGFPAEVLLWVGGIGAIATAFLCAASPFVRYRRAEAEERQQIRWLAYAGAAVGTSLVLMLLSQAVAPAAIDWLWLAFFVSFALGIPIASGIAILRYRLYELDIVVKRTVMFGILASFITGAYLLVVIGIPTLIFGADGGGRNAVPFLAAAILAVLFQPVRSGARRLANRLVYGKRASPYELLSEFAGRIGGAYSMEDVLPRMARAAAEGTGATRASVWLRVGSEMRPEASWPAEAPGGDAIPATDEALSRLPGADRAFPVRHRGELLGALGVEMPRAEPLTPATVKLLDDLAAHAALILRNVRLTEELKERLEELRASRQRLVSAQDEERRRLERNIHDGAQQQLVALAVQMNLVQALVGKDPRKAATMAAQAKRGLQEALDDLRDLARGIYPPLLQDKGLAAALEAQARKSPLPVEVEADGIGRFPQDAEAAVYFCVLEALQNAAKYAEASAASVRLGEGDGELTFSVSDDGKGFDQATTPRGSGLQNMADRVEALGGSLEIRSTPGEGTTVSGRLPVAGGSAVGEGRSA